MDIPLFIFTTFLVELFGQINEGKVIPVTDHGGP
jgi:hypothetical protein